MKALIIGYDKFTDSKFSYELNNVVAVQVILDNIIIHNIEDDSVVIHKYLKDDVKIIIEN